MIPKVIHFCWLSNDLYPEKIQYCIASWKKNLPDYEIKLWDLKRFDIKSSKWCEQAFGVKKYAFAADYIRCYALFTEGGIYLDSDVEVLKSFNDLLDLPYFIGRDHSNKFEPAIMGFEPDSHIMKKLLDYYKTHDFIKDDGSYEMLPLPDLMEKVVSSFLTLQPIESKSEFTSDKSRFCLFPYDYFSPKRQDNFKIEKSVNTYTIHHFNASWYTPAQKMFRILSRVFGFKFMTLLSSFIKKQ